MTGLVNDANYTLKCDAFHFLSLSKLKNFFYHLENVFKGRVTKGINDQHCTCLILFQVFYDFIASFL